MDNISRNGSADEIALLPPSSSRPQLLSPSEIFHWPSSSRPYHRLVTLPPRPAGHYYQNSRWGPFFEEGAEPYNLTARVGTTVRMNCKIGLLHDKTVSILESFCVFLSLFWYANKDAGHVFVQREKDGLIFHFSHVTPIQLGIYRNIKLSVTFEV